MDIRNSCTGQRCTFSRSRRTCRGCSDLELGEGGVDLVRVDFVGGEAEAEFECLCSLFTSHISINTKERKSGMWEGIVRTERSSSFDSGTGASSGSVMTVFWESFNPTRLEDSDGEWTDDGDDKAVPA
jgi:hypothetical protein